MGRRDVHQEQAGLLEGGCLLLFQDGQDCLSLFGVLVPAVMIMVHVCKLVLKVSHMTTPPKQAHERLQGVLTCCHDGGGLQNEVQRDMPLVLEALRAAVSGVMDKQPSGCGDPLGGRRRIIM